MYIFNESKQSYTKCKIRACFLNVFNIYRTQFIYFSCTSGYNPGLVDWCLTPDENVTGKPQKELGLLESYL